MESAQERRRVHELQRALCCLFAIAGVASCSGGGKFSTGSSSSGGTDASPGDGGRDGSGGASGGTSATGGSVETGGGGAGGVPGSGGSVPDSGIDGGSGGEPVPPPQCKNDEDCVAFTCNGAPRCESGTCAAGDPCEQPAAGGCESVCVREATRARCTLVAKDVDGDGYKDVLCAEAPGTDCNDADDAIHPGATEACDGIDNDCDGKKDALDGALLNRREPQLIKTVGQESAQLAITRKDLGFAVLGLQKTKYDALGVPTEVHVLTGKGEYQNSYDVSSTLNAPDPAFALTPEAILLPGRLLSPATPGSATDFIALNEAGGVSGTVSLATTASGLVGTGRTATRDVGRDGMVMAWVENPSQVGGPLGGVALLLITPDGQTTGYQQRVVSVASSLFQAGRPNIAAAQSGYALAWVEQGAGATTGERALTGRLTVTSKTLTGTKSVTLDTISTRLAPYLAAERMRPQVVTADGNYFAGWLKPGGGFGAMAVSDTGTTICGPSTLTGVSSWGSASSLVSTPLGVIAAVTGKDGDAALYRISKGPGTTAPPCTFERLGPVNYAGTRVAQLGVATNGDVALTLGDPVIAAGPGGTFGVAWTERDETAEEAGDAGARPPRDNRLVIRVLDANLCAQ